MLVEVMNWTVITWACKYYIATFPEPNPWRRTLYEVLNNWLHRINYSVGICCKFRWKVKHRRRLFRIQKRIAEFQKRCRISKIRLSLKFYYKVWRKALLQSATTGISKCHKISLQNAIMQGCVVIQKIPVLTDTTCYICYWLI